MNWGIRWIGSRCFKRKPIGNHGFSPSNIAAAYHASLGPIKDSSDSWPVTPGNSKGFQEAPATACNDAKTPVGVGFWTVLQCSTCVFVYISVLIGVFYCFQLPMCNMCIQVYVCWERHVQTKADTGAICKTAAPVLNYFMSQIAIARSHLCCRKKNIVTELNNSYD